MLTYLYIGLAFYSIVGAMNWRTFKGASKMSVLKGIGFGVGLWPIAALYMCFPVMYKD